MWRFLALAVVLLTAQLSLKAAAASQQRLVYEITVTNPGTKSQGWHGTLYDQSGEPVQAEPSTRVKTIAGEFESVAKSQPWVPYGMIHGDTLRWLKEHGADVIFDSEPWAYKLYVTNEGSKSQGFRGELLRGGGVVTPESDGEHVKTPMGTFDWHKSPYGWGSHGWIHASWSGWGVQQ